MRCTNQYSYNTLNLPYIDQYYIFSIIANLLTKVLEIFLGDTGESRADAEDDEDELFGTPAANFASDSTSGIAGVSFLIVLNGVSPQAVG